MKKVAVALMALVMLFSVVFPPEAEAILCRFLLFCIASARDAHREDRRDCLRDADKKGREAVQHCLQEARQRYNQRKGQCCSNANPYCKRTPPCW